MLDKQITKAYAAIEIAIGRDKLMHAQFKINVQLPTPQPSDDRVGRTSVFDRYTRSLILIRVKLMT